MTRATHGHARRAVLAAALLLASMTAVAATAGAGAQLQAVLADFDRYYAEADPIGAGQRGNLAALARWPDDSPAAVSARRATLTALDAQLKRLAGAALSGEDALNRDLLRDRIELDLDGYGFDEERIPFNTGDGFHTVPDYAADGIALRTEPQARAWIAKLAALPEYYATEIANMRRGLATGFVRPRLVAAQVTATLRERASQPADASALLKPLEDLPASLPADTRAQLVAEARDVLRTRVKPAEQALVAFFEREYLPGAAPAIGIGALPGGDAYYAYLIRRHASTRLSAEQIHALGLAEIERIGIELRQAIAATGYTGTPREFLERLRGDPRFTAASVDDYVAKTRDFAKRTDALLPRYFGTLPRLTYGVQLVAPNLKGSSSGYNPGSPEQGLSGTVVVNVDAAALDQSPLYGMPAWALHEGVPGHHLQIALAQERTDLPAFRRNSDVNAFVEGWALYSERLGVEMGLYRTPYETVGRLSLEMWRACRLVIDTGMHVLGWTRDRAVACLRDHTGLSRHAIDYEVDRYIGWPGQALGYKVGEIRIRELRARAERVLGAKFDLRAFHDAVLLAGAMPLDRLEERIDRWIQAHR